MKKNKTLLSAEIAAKKFEGGYRCSEALLSAYGERVGLPHDFSMKIGCALGGGLGGHGDICGAVSAAIIILGLKYGRTNKDDADKRLQTDEQTQKFLKKFKSKHKHCACNDLIGFDRSTVKGHAAAVASGVFKRRCPVFVKDAALILEELL